MRGGSHTEGSWRKGDQASPREKWKNKKNIEDCGKGGEWVFHDPTTERTNTRIGNKGCPKQDHWTWNWWERRVVRTRTSIRWDVGGWYRVGRYRYTPLGDPI